MTTKSQMLSLIKFVSLVKVVYCLEVQKDQVSFFFVWPYDCRVMQIVELNQFNLIQSNHFHPSRHLLHIALHRELYQGRPAYGYVRCAASRRSAFFFDTIASLLI